MGPFLKFECHVLHYFKININLSVSQLIIILQNFSKGIGSVPQQCTMAVYTMAIYQCMPVIQLKIYRIGVHS